MSNWINYDCYYFSDGGDVRLTDRHLPSLVHQLKIHAPKWREIGLHLGFLPGELSNIESRPSLIQGAPVSFLGALLKELVQWAPGDSRGSIEFATLESLKNALNSAGLGATAYDLTVEPRMSSTRFLGIYASPSTYMHPYTGNATKSAVFYVISSPIPRLCTLVCSMCA